MQLELSKIKEDGGTQPRAMFYPGTLEEYAEDMANGAEFPPVTVFYDGTNYWLVDGFHRVTAARSIGIETIDVEVHQGTLEEAQWYSYSVNATHGRRRTNEDKQRAVEAALKHPKAVGMGSREIADHCGVSHVLVNNIRNELKSTVKNLQSPIRTGRDGRTTNTANIGKTKHRPPTQPSQNGHDSAAPMPTSAPEPESDNTDPDEVFHATLIRFSDSLRRIANETLPGGLSSDAFQRIMDIVAQDIAVNI